MKIKQQKLPKSFQVHDLPPTYTIAVLDTGGILNPTFASDEQPTTADDAAGSSNSQSRESDIKSNNRTSDTVLHI